MAVVLSVVGVQLWSLGCFVVERGSRLL
jgi:hypothetical protein